MSNCKYETSNGRCGLKGSYAYRYKCYQEDMCRCHEPKTNADHIRSMTDEELADFISNLSYTDAWKCGEHYVDCNNECEKCVAEWLKQPYKEDT